MQTASIRRQFAWNVKTCFLGKIRKICMKSQNLFSGKNKKNISICRLLKILPRQSAKRLNTDMRCLINTIRQRQWRLQTKTVKTQNSLCIYRSLIRVFVEHLQNYPALYKVYQQKVEHTLFWEVPKDKIPHDRTFVNFTTTSLIFTTL